MAKYDGLIIPRSYNDYINKSDPLGVSQALQLTGVMDNAPTAQSTKPAKSGGIFAANAVIMASSATLSGVAISAGSVVRVLFTAALTGSDAETGLTLTYNGNAYAVKVGKNGALANFNAYEVESGVFKYLQAYTTLELMFDGTQFIIIGNPVVLSNADYTIYPDGLITKKPTPELLLNGNFPNDQEFHINSDIYEYLYIDSAPKKNYHYTLLIPCTFLTDTYIPYWLNGFYQDADNNMQIAFWLKNNYIKKAFILENGTILTSVKNTKVYGITFCR